jgi:hypothetical protein
MVEITERAVGAILEVMRVQRLDPRRFCIEFKVQDGKVSLNFNRDGKATKVINGLKVFEDPFITEDVYVDFVEDGNGRQGIIFTGERYEH